MAADEIHRHAGFVHVFQERRNPRRLRGCRTAHANLRTHRFQRAHGVVVQFEIGRLLGIAAPEIDIGFVPYLEIPARDFIDAVAIDEVPRERLDHGVPFRIAFRRHHVGAVPERVVLRRIGTQRLRHEAQFDERFDPVRQEAVVDLVDVGKVVGNPAVLIAIHDADVVVEDAVEAHVLEAGGRVHGVEILAVVVAQRQHRATRTERLLPEVREWRGLRGGIHPQMHGLRGRSGRGHAGNSTQRKRQEQREPT